MSACVRVCVRDCVRACARARVRVCVHACVRVCVFRKTSIFFLLQNYNRHLMEESAEDFGIWWMGQIERAGFRVKLVGTGVRNNICVFVYLDSAVT